MDEMLPAPLEKSGNSQGIWFGMESGHPVCAMQDHPEVSLVGRDDPLQPGCLLASVISQFVDISYV